MNLTELAHWRYRISALERELVTAKRWTSTFSRTLHANRDENWELAYTQAHEIEHFTKWLLEEARYV